MTSFKLLILAIALASSLSLISGKSVSFRQKRILKGEYDYENNHRYHVAILKISEEDTLEHVCGGAIIEGRYVLTAAHCVYEFEKEELIVRSGWNKDPGHPVKEKRAFHKVAKIMYLKDYHHTQCRNHEHDIAVLKVSRSFDLADEEHFIKVNLPEYDNDYEGYHVTFTGYGAERIREAKAESDEEISRSHNVTRRVFKYPEELKYLNTQVIPQHVCKRVAQVVVTNGNVCTKSENPDGFSCIGDSGSPLVFDNVVIGVRNSHDNQCIHDQPEMFTRVSAYLEFIYKALNQDSSADIVYK